MYGVELHTDGSCCVRELGMTSWVPDTEMYNEMAATMSELQGWGGAADRWAGDALDQVSGERAQTRRAL